MAELAMGSFERLMFWSARLLGLGVGSEAWSTAGLVSKVRAHE